MLYTSKVLQLELYTRLKRGLNFIVAKSRKNHVPGTSPNNSNRSDRTIYNTESKDSAIRLFEKVLKSRQWLPCLHFNKLRLRNLFEQFDKPTSHYLLYWDPIGTIWFVYFTSCLYQFNLISQLLVKFICLLNKSICLKIASWFNRYSFPMF